MVAIIKYNAGNIASVKNAVERLGFDCVITDDINKIQNANKVIFPGVGEAKSAMNHLTNNGLSGCIKSLLQPTLGICLGLQLLCQYSEEGDTECLKIFETSVKKFPADDIVPHMGWNNISINTEPLFKGLNKDDAVYFLHSYYAGICEQTIATCNYILPFSAAMRKDNFYATQFHPEKSGDVGELILKNFLEL
ncbi:MAG TPA: imidazole glycerol phosphate synthase subunit HisH [Fermentimonas caenicola]|jgi:glutamine amidotransferase|uniref:Imidazole glycerol phosphate synthase subunit HisH n=1 Tax=Fermentimonas caenicola TaxID=1562970 RepID=A0A098BZH4_9BACT|nr:MULTISPECIES: imidazole glycerol phosphate synthase subunit HisH [Lascolabacillus]MBP6174631.1 imidazole glycerol phosphate synthase subunit HisH [Fermentimonas sp.]MDI9626799.1 imidazole glycerol phosphate synthase subunit HisH [Bacteroidota bacterium]TAH61257.1 MAG: imidazole glycerol phosphate synthase subunit HisH [Fermentimonas caenicola]MBP6196863.1 imidazole glycerol phosphate synthase subunit HisH [Fermentimonas sp.]MBP7104369.1 imidazole glycerol phosphate synthase subunit HisH [Fe